MSACISRLATAAARRTGFQATRAAQALAFKRETADSPVPSLRGKLESDINAYFKWDSFAADSNPKSIRSCSAAVAARLSKHPHPTVASPSSVHVVEDLPATCLQK